jgi:hypothetical protein
MNLNDLHIDQQITKISPNWPEKRAKPGIWRTWVNPVAIFFSFLAVFSFSSNILNSYQKDG